MSALETSISGAAQAFAKLDGRKLLATSARERARAARPWLGPVAVVMFLRSREAARSALDLLREHDQGAKLISEAGVAARVPWAVAVAAGVAVGLRKLVAVTQKGGTIR